MAKTVKITWNNPKDIKAGTPLDGTQLNAQAIDDADNLVAGAFAYTPDAGAVLPAGVHTLRAAFSPADPTTYDAATESVSISIVARPVKVVWKDPADIKAGTPLDGAHLNAEAFDETGSPVAGAFAYTPAAGAILPVGVHTLRAAFTPADPQTYDDATESVSIAVNPKPLKVVWRDPADIKAGTPLGASQLCAEAINEAGDVVAGAFTYDPAAGVVLRHGVHTLDAIFEPADSKTYESASVTSRIRVQLTVSGRLMVGDCPLEGVRVTVADCDQSFETVGWSKTDAEGRYEIPVDPDRDIRIEFPQRTPFQRHDVVLKGAQYVYARSCQPIDLDRIYEAAGCQISGKLERQSQGSHSSEPLSDASVALLRDGRVASSWTTDECGQYCIRTDATGLLTLQFSAVDGLVASERTMNVWIPECPCAVSVPTVTYTALTTSLCGQVNCAGKGLENVPIELLGVDGICLAATESDDEGLWRFRNLPPGKYQVRFRNRVVDGGESFELSKSLQLSDPISLGAGDTKHLAPVSYEPEPHIIERQVLVGGQPIDGILVDVRVPGAPSALQSARTVSGWVRFTLDIGGEYEVRYYPDPNAFGDPLVDFVEVHSVNTGKMNLPPLPSGFGSVRKGLGAGNGGGNGRGGGNGAREAIEDLASYPVLTEEIGYPPSPLARSGGLPTAPSGTSLGQSVTKAISDVLGWQLKPDPKAFLGALNASFSLKDVEGHTEAYWAPRSYAIQTDLSGGGVSGAQASVYARAKDALDQSLPLLEGLYPLFKEAADDDVAALRATVRSQFTDLVNELGLLGGPRIARVTQFFFLLLGQQLPQTASLVPAFIPQLVTDPDQISGSLGNLRTEFGFSLSDDLVNTVEDEQNVTNYRIVADYLTSLATSWLNNLQFFGLTATTPFFGTQLVLLSRQLSVIAETVDEVRFTLDSVFIGPAERQTLQIDFSSPPGAQPMFLEDLLTWIDSFASEEGPKLIQDGGKFAVSQSFVPIGTQLQQLAQGAIKPTNITLLPSGYNTLRVQRSIKDLSDQLQQLVSLATPIAHVITPEPEPALSVLGINPNVVFLSAWPVGAGNKQLPVPITIIGTGFDVNNAAGLKIAFIPPAPANTLVPNGSGILSDNLAYMTLNPPSVSSIPAGSYNVTITMTNRNGQTSTLVVGFTVLP
jgi:hypothetical protein